MKNILLATIFALVTLAFTACSEGDGAFKNADSASKLDINVDCIVNPVEADIATYITITTGDVVVTEDSNSSVSTYHDINGTKKVCRVSGSAYIIR